MRHRMNLAGAGGLVCAAVVFAASAAIASRCDGDEKVPVKTAIYRTSDGTAPVQQVRYGYGWRGGYYGGGWGGRYGYYRPFGYGGYYRGGFYGPVYGGYGWGPAYGYGYGYPAYGYSYAYPGYGYGYYGYPSVGIGIW